MYATAYSTLLYFHIAAGTIACLSAAGAISVAKGKAAHARFGIAYALSMAVVVLSAFAMAAIKPNLFLAMIGVFSGYLVASGYLRAKRRSAAPQASDWLLAGLGMAAGIAMVLIAALGKQALGTVLLAFGGLMIALSARDLRHLKLKTYRGGLRIAAHLTYMLGATIANVTAVLVVNWQSNPAWLAWLLPTLLIVPMIVYWNVRVLRQAPAKP